VAYAGGYAGGYADTEVASPAPTPVSGSPVWSPAHPAQPAGRRKGRATLRLKVTATTWGAEGEHRSSLATILSARCAGVATGQARTGIAGGIQARSGVASGLVRTSLQTHTGDPREDDRVILLAVSALLLGRTE
jgi:hypothetical protein